MVRVSSAKRREDRIKREKLRERERERERE